MGCCISTNAAKHDPIFKHSKSPPPSSISMDLELETVKEVLSAHKLITPKLEDTVATTKPTPTPAAPHAHHLFDQMPNPNSTPVRQHKEISQICSPSEGATDRDRQDDDVTSLRIHRSPAKLRQTRSFSGDLGSQRERVLVGKSPNRRLPDPSPTRRNGGLERSVRRIGLGNEEQIRADRSGRRSQSPAVRSNNTGQIPSEIKTNQYPGRVRAAPLRSGGNSKESLENPMVSLECFIFI